ncbi:ImuA family protein [Dinghuibacter silviterrae]|uniref:Protein ImuA n=1 Tax=Dinghuibacter silviterrae TaxID=1539049 RepID=A0A4R8DVE3_9BACT|nr:Error-prone repair protein ImuA [Dinghuibacter silviterrae]TDX01888.1 protein ImuA [Dinghuibacter silviterrae]
MSSTPDIVRQLQREIHLLQGFKPPAAGSVEVGLGPVTAGFPNGTFPTGAIHEFLSEHTGAATCGFIAGLVAPLMAAGGACIWVGRDRKVYPPGLKFFGLEPDRVIFVDVRKDKEVLWVLEEALKCEGLAAVVGEAPDIGLTASRRLQLAVEQSRVTGFILREQGQRGGAQYPVGAAQPPGTAARGLGTIASVARWRILPLASSVEDDLPGLGHPRWRVTLERVRNGKGGTWDIEWREGQFHCMDKESPAAKPWSIDRGTLARKTG